ncbi:hypothetical protein ERJ75_001042400 [Trypanosoma vivax]|nr:hypothetical protein TRVL_09413 [Trypanosoma vivax]KAH8610949.1 hypothetical protein ERJ75_001042400 [Trypanosoma vivax]
MLGHAKSLRDTKGVLAAEYGLFKAWRVRTATKTRGAGAQRSEPNTKQAHRSTGMVSHASKAGKQQQQQQEKNNPLTTNVGFRGIQGLRDELGEAPFEPEEKIRTDEGALGYLMATSPERLFSARRDMFPMPPKNCFLFQDALDAMALWTRAVGGMGLTEGLNRPGRCVYNR